jgi:hypothetical protein
MERNQTDLQTIATAEPALAPAEGLPGLDPLKPARRFERILRCVSSGHLTDGCSCHCTIPSRVVTTAWADELGKVRGDRFFHFAWRGGVWLAYGLMDGEVRGVYCPEHCAEREERTLSGYSSQRRADHELAVAA